VAAASVAATAAAEQEARAAIDVEVNTARGLVRGVRSAILYRLERGADGKLMAGYSLSRRCRFPQALKMRKGRFQILTGSVWLRDLKFRICKTAPQATLNLAGPGQAAETKAAAEALTAVEARRVLQVKLHC
jgi:hypothetical protein